MKQILIFAIFILFAGSLQSQESVMYRLHLKDKGNPSYTISNPEEYLSPKSIERRVRQNLPVDSVDLPLDSKYLDAISETGATIRTYSKWVNTVVVHFVDMNILDELTNLPFVDTLYCVWRGTLPVNMRQYSGIAIEQDFQENSNDNYGTGFTQVALNNGHLLHNSGFRGKGVSIAVLDAGFINVDKIDFFNQERIKEVRNFSHDASDILREGSDHGTRVLSCMLSNKQSEMIGTAPDADYYLFRTEVMNEEFPVEEDYWIAALEYSDSLGIDIVTSSLGYSTFDDVSMNHKQEQLDGLTIPISRAANLAASRGILLFNSAGNDGNNNWEKINFPADSEHIITVGSVFDDSTRSAFSSHGYTVDKRVKPDLMAMGSGVNIVNYSGTIANSSGTSFSTPILAGLSACLWEALPDLGSFELLDLLRESGSRFQNPDSLMGYGIADVYKAYHSKQTGFERIYTPFEQVFMSINPYDNRLYINLGKYNRYVLNIYSALGNSLLSLSGAAESVDVSSLPKGIYIARLRINDRLSVHKVIKR